MRNSKLDSAEPFGGPSSFHCVALLYLEWCPCWHSQRWLTSKVAFPPVGREEGGGSTHPSFKGLFQVLNIPSTYILLARTQSQGNLENVVFSCATRYPAKISIFVEKEENRYWGTINGILFHLLVASLNQFM